MKTQDIVCPECRRTVKGYQPAFFPPDGVPEKGYTWIRPFRHKREGTFWHPGKRMWCHGSSNRYYVGDASL